MKKFYATIDLTKRNKILPKSSINYVYRYNQIVELVEDFYGGNKKTKWYCKNDDSFFLIPEDCYTKLSKEDYPEYYL